MQGTPAVKWMDKHRLARGLYGVARVLEEQTGAMIQSPGNAELCATICELARQLGYHPVKTKLLVGQWRLDLVGLERKLQHELDEGPRFTPEYCEGKRSR